MLALRLPALALGLLGATPAAGAAADDVVLEVPAFTAPRTDATAELALEARCRSVGALYVVDAWDGGWTAERESAPDLRLVLTFEGDAQAADLRTMLERDAAALAERLGAAATGDWTEGRRVVAGIDRAVRTRTHDLEGAALDLVVAAWTEASPFGSRLAGAILRLDGADDPVAAVAAALEVEPLGPDEPIPVRVGDHVLPLPARHRIANVQPQQGEDGTVLDLTVETSAGRIALRVGNADTARTAARLTADFRAATARTIANDADANGGSAEQGAGSLLPAGGGYLEVSVDGIRKGAQSMELSYGAWSRGRELVQFTVMTPRDGVHRDRLVRMLAGAAAGSDTAWPAATVHQSGVAWRVPASLVPRPGDRDASFVDSWAAPQRGETIEEVVAHVLRRRLGVRRLVFFAAGGGGAADRLEAAETDLVERLRRAIASDGGEDDAGVELPPATTRTAFYGEHERTLRFRRVDFAARPNDPVTIVTMDAGRAHGVLPVVLQAVAAPRTAEDAAWTLASIADAGFAGRLEGPVDVGPGLLALEAPEHLAVMPVRRAADADRLPPAARVFRDGIELTCRPADVEDLDLETSPLDRLAARALRAEDRRDEFVEATVAGRPARVLPGAASSSGETRVRSVEAFTIDERRRPWTIVLKVEGKDALARGLELLGRIEPRG